VCSGVEAPSLAWGPLGWTAEFFAEIEKFPSAVLAHRFQEVPNLGDFTRIGKEIEVGSIDVLVGGTPCQSFSVAGKRAGLDDPRGNLTLEYVALAGRIRPRWLVWENVPGVLSIDGGRTFGALLWLLGQLGYGVAYAVLDAQHFGVPQRRRRVFVVGCLGDWRRAAAVLLEPTCLQGNPPPSREAREGTTAGTPRGFGVGGEELARSLSASNERIDAETETFIAHTLRGSGFDASEDGTGRGTPLVPVPFDTTQITSAANYSNPKPGDPCHPPAIAFSTKDRGTSVDVAPTLTAESGDPHMGGRVAVAYESGPLDTDGHTIGILAPSLTTNDPSRSPQASEVTDQVAAVHAASMSVRRLTPRECERLQGMPDDWTLVPYGRGLAADGPRYKAIGNSMAVPVMRWIGERIAFVDSLLSEIAS
jgi:DNA (cytosine-5)-methyltransferase 1